MAPAVPEVGERVSGGVSDLEPDQGDDVPVALPARTDGPFRTKDEAQRCGAILGRALRCDPPRSDRAPLIL